MKNVFLLRLSHMSYPFNVRVYGLLIHEERILLADEYFHDTYITKFPGGGLQFGEGTIECIKRECMEELNIPVIVKAHFYTTDFFQPSIFDSSKQIISIYYLLQFAGEVNIKVSEKKFDFEEQKNNSYSFRWMNLKSLSPDDVTFPIDKKVVELLHAELK